MPCGGLALLQRDFTDLSAVGRIITPVADQVFRCDQVRDRYLGTIYAGLCDPAEILPEFLTELQKAGIDAVIAEKQRQLDLYLQGE